MEKQVRWRYEVRVSVQRAESIRRGLSLGVWLWWLLPMVAQAEQWSVERVLDAVRSSDPGAASVSERADAMRADARGGWAGLSPRITLGSSLLRSDDPALLFSEKLRQGRFTTEDFAIDRLNQPDAETNLGLSLTIDQPLWNGGTEVTTPSWIAEQRHAADGMEQAGLADRLLYAVQVYAGALRAQVAVQSDSVGMVAAEEGARAAAARFRTGQVAELDTLRAASRRAEASAAWLESRRSLEVALASLSQLVGETVRAADLEPRVEQARTFETSGSHPVRSDDASQGERGEIIAARADAKRLAIEAKRAGLRLLPSLNARAMLDQFRKWDGGDFEPRWTAGLMLQLPLWDGTERWSAYRAAQSRARAAEAAQESLERNLLVQELDARTDLELVATRRATVLLQRSTAEEAERLALDRYRAGLLPLQEWLDASADAARARTRFADVEAGAVFLQYRYLHAVGALR